MAASDIDSAIQALAWETTSWKSMEVVVETARERPKPVHDGAFVKSTHRYTETQDGKRSFRSENLTVGGDIFPAEAYCDGRRCALITFAAAKPHPPVLISLTRGFMLEDRIGFTDRPEPLKYFYVGLVPLHEALPKARQRGESRRLNRPCDRYHFESVKGGGGSLEMIYDLDRATGIPLRVEAYASPADMASGTIAWAWEAESIVTFQGYHVAGRSHYESYGSPPGKPGSERMVKSRETHTVSSLKFDQTHPETTFWPEFPPGVRIINALDRTITTVPGGPQPKQETATTPIRAGELGSMPGWIAPTGFILGFTCLIVAIILRRRSSG